MYLAKIDCEGAEKYLTEADPDLIKAIPNWVMEIHSAEIENTLIDLFTKLGFQKELKETVIDIKDARVTIWHFYRA